MALKKIFAARTAFSVIFLLALYVSLQADHPFLKEIFSEAAELCFLLNYGFFLLIFAAAWRYLYYDFSRQKYLLRNIFVSLFLLICSFPGFLFVLPGIFSGGVLCGLAALWSGSTLGTLEKKFGKKYLGFNIIFWITPLPFLLYSAGIRIPNGLGLAAAAVFLWLICTVVHFTLIKKWHSRPIKIWIGLCTVGFTALVCFFAGQGVVYHPADSQAQNMRTSTQSDPLFPLLVLSLLHSSDERQDILILSERKLSPEIQTVSSSMKMIRKIRAISPKEAYSKLNIQNGSPSSTFHVILYDTDFTVSLQNAMFLSADFFRDLKKKLSPGGVFALNLRRSDPSKTFSYSILCHVLGSVFQHVEHFSGGKRFLCMNGRKKLVTDPEILEYRADKWGNGREHFPKGVFHLLLSDHEQIFFPDETGATPVNPVEMCLQSGKSGSIFLEWRKKIEKIRLEIPFFAWLTTLLLLSGYGVCRYFCVAKDKHGKFFSFDHGFFMGGLAVLLSVYLPLKWGYMHPFFSVSYFIYFLCGFYCGMYSGGKLCAGKKWDILFAAAGCIPLSLFRIVFYEELYNGLVFLSGGLACGFFIRKYSLFCKEYFLGAGSALLMGTFSLVLPGAFHLPFLLAAAAVENVKKGFEKE